MLQLVCDGSGSRHDEIHGDGKLQTADSADQQRILLRIHFIVRNFISALMGNEEMFISGTEFFQIKRCRNADCFKLLQGSLHASRIIVPGLEDPIGIRKKQFPGSSGFFILFLRHDLRVVLQIPENLKQAEAVCTQNRIRIAVCRQEIVIIYILVV